jgi:hypothetical protein
MRELQEMQSEFAQASELMDQKYKQLAERFAELQELYEGRPSRPEDLELIRQLQEEIVQKDNLLKKAAEDMKFYKLELINREQSYNQMFGTNPNVGVINPTGKAAQMQKQPSMAIGGKPAAMGIGGMGISAGPPVGVPSANAGKDRGGKSRLV